MSQEINHKLSRRQLLALAYVSLLSPLVRRTPRFLTLISGRAAWLTPFAAALLLLGLFFLMYKLLQKMGPGKGLDTLLCERLGPGIGRIVLGIYGLWLLLYTGFILRSGADRFISTVYPHSSPGVFVVVMLLLALIAASGNLKATARAAMVFRPALLGVFLLVALFSIQNIHTDELLPVSRLDLGPAFLGALPLVNTISIVVYLCFLESEVEDRPQMRPYLFWLLMTILTTLIICVATIGALGADLTARTSYPFFTMIRDIKLFNTLERIDAVVIALWVFTDFILVSTLLFITTKLFSAVWPPLGKKPRILTVLQGLVLLILGLNLTDSAFSLNWYSDFLIPRLNLIFVLALPILLLVGRLRKSSKP
jgi:spore germination protein KB